MIGQMQPFSHAWANVTRSSAGRYLNVGNNGRSGIERITVPPIVARVIDRFPSMYLSKPA